MAMHALTKPQMRLSVLVAKSADDPAPEMRRRLTVTFAAEGAADYRRVWDQ